MRSIFGRSVSPVLVSAPDTLPDRDKARWNAVEAMTPDAKRILTATIALCGACATGDEALAEYYIQREGADINGRCYKPNAPLYAAIDTDQPHMVELLKRHGAEMRPYDLDKHPTGREIGHIIYGQPALD